MVDNDTIENKISDKKEELEENVEEIEDNIDDEINETEENTDEIEDDANEDEEEVEDREARREARKERYEERREKNKAFADNVINDLNKTIDELKDNLKNMQKAADQKYTDYKKATVQSLDVDLIESNDIYYIKVAVPGIDKEEINIEASDNDITIEATFKPIIEEFEEGEAEVIVSSLKSGRCVKTLRFENSIDVNEISAKFANGIVLISVPKLIIPKHKVTVE